ncbi:MAG: AbrB/MazE/SpoVT family DNA-binding domain-containing protein, partial [bacterium]
EGDLFDIQVQMGKIVLEPQVVIPRDEQSFYSLESQRSLKRALKDFEEGRVHGPFDNAEDLIESLET